MSKDDKDNSQKVLKMVAPSNIAGSFSNYAECRIAKEEVVITFCQREYDNPAEEACPVFRVYMTIPHFLRFANMMKQNIEEIELFLTGEKDNGDNDK